MSAIAIVGGGASGLLAACMLASAGKKPILLERQSRVGRKLLSTGNGRCNLTNLRATIENYHGSAAHLRAALAAFPPSAAVEFFTSLGVICAPDEEGRVYPLSNQAAGVLDALRLRAAELGCDMRTEWDVQSIARKGERFQLTSANGERLSADYILLCCGGLAAPKLGGCASGYKLLESFGHHITPRMPGLAALRAQSDSLRALKGIRARAEVTLLLGERILRSEAGEIIFGEGSVSGIAAMQLARDANLALKRGEKPMLRLNFLSDAPEGFIQRRAKLLSERSMEDFLSGIVPKRLGQVLVKLAGVPQSLAARELTAQQLDGIQAALVNWRLPIIGTMDFDQAQITCGGANLAEFSPDTLESLRVPGLFAAGELLDIDGDCGGFNLQWAWSSAHLAARALRER